MTKRVVVILMTCLAGLAASATAQAHAPTPRCHAHATRKTVKVRERRHGKRVWVTVSRCVKVTTVAPAPTPTPTPTPTPPSTAPAPTVSYAAQVDPSFTQAPGDPLAVTYAYSADATASTAATALTPAATVDLAGSGELPDGVLNFYSPTTPAGPSGLVCSMNVGGGVSSGECPVSYQETGTYAVTTQYIPDGVSAVNATDSETISPFSTTTTEQVSSVPYGSGFGYAIRGTPTVTDQNGNVLPAGSVATTVTLTQLAGQVTEMYCLGGAALLLPQVGATLSCNGLIEVEISAPSTATLALTGEYPGGPGYAGSVSQAATTTVS